MIEQISVLRGRVITHIEVDDRNDSILFVCDNGDKFQMYHEQDCCENVYIEDIIGDLDDLLNTPIIVAEERESFDEPSPEDYEPESYTWTFYTFRTIKGTVDIRWFGSSNGYYSESVYFKQIKRKRIF